MILELHVLQNVAPNNLNRNDVGAPKDCIFGGTRRARVSSQSWKRAMRDRFKQEHLIPQENSAYRSRRLVHEIAARVRRELNTEIELEGVENAVAEILQTVGSQGKIAVKKETEDNGTTVLKTDTILFLGIQEIEKMASLVVGSWDRLTSAAKTERSKIARELGAKIVPLLKGHEAADIALFGRMIAKLPEGNVDGSAQVAHAISTHTIATEFDFYTAVDDLRPEDTEGADMLGTIEFVSSTLYRYANLDLDQLSENLQADADLVQATTQAFADTFVRSLPSGKQNSMAAHNPPSIAVAVIRESGRWSLANAFVEAARPKRNQDLMELSVKKLGSYWTRLTEMYGDDAVIATPVLVDSAYQDAAAAFGDPVSGMQAWLDTIKNELGREAVAS